MHRNARDAAIFWADLSWGKRASSLFALKVGNLSFKKSEGMTVISVTFYFDKVMREPHTITLTPHPVKEKDPIYAFLQVSTSLFPAFD
jgi:hypothetical protein